METLPEILLSIWINLCILITIALSVLGLAALFCTLIQPDARIPRLEYFSGFVWCTVLAGFFYTHVWCLQEKSKESHKTRDVLIQVPEKVQIHTEFRLDDTVIGKEVL